MMNAQRPHALWFPIYDPHRNVHCCTVAVSSSKSSIAHKGEKERIIQSNSSPWFCSGSRVKDEKCHYTIFFPSHKSQDTAAQSRWKPAKRELEHSTDSPFHIKFSIPGLIQPSESNNRLRTPSLAQTAKEKKKQVIPTSAMKSEAKWRCWCIMRSWVSKVMKLLQGTKKSRWWSTNHTPPARTAHRVAS